MTIRLNGATSGYTELDAPAVAGSNTLVLPGGNGSAGQLLKNGSTPGNLEFSSNVSIDSSGRLLVGTSTARSNFNNTTDSAHVQFEGTTATTRRLAIISSEAGSGAGAIILAHQRSGTIGGNTVLQSGDAIGAIAFDGSDGTDFVRGAEISVQVDGTPGSNDMPGRLMFSTTADGASSPTERMRITSGGNFLVGSTVVPNVSTGGTGFSVTSNELVFSSDTSATISYWRTASGAGKFVASFWNGTNNVGNISTNTTSTTYNTSSDYRLKENVIDLDGAIDRLKHLPVHRFNFIADPDTVVDGFIAHEAQEVVPECVTGEKDAVDDDGNPVYQGIDQSKLVPLLTAALQEAIAKIESLEARLTALEVTP